MLGQCSPLHSLKNLPLTNTECMPEALTSNCNDLMMITVIDAMYFLLMYFQMK